MRQWATIALFMGVLINSAAEAQPGRPGGRSRGGFGVPSPGATLKNVKLYDDQGKPFQLSELRGSYSVITFGCLT